MTSNVTKSMQHNISVTKRQAEGVRASIKAVAIANRLQQHINGEVELSATQIQAAKILLDRVVPTLQAVHVEAGDGIDLVSLLTEARQRVLGSQPIPTDVDIQDAEVLMGGGLGTEGECVE